MTFLSNLQLLLMKCFIWLRRIDHPGHFIQKCAPLVNLGKRNLIDAVPLALSSQL